MDWTQIAVAIAPALASVGLTAAAAKLLAGRRGRARKTLADEIDQYKSIPDEIAAKDEYARYLVVAVREYSGEDPFELNLRYRTQRLLAASALGVSLTLSSAIGVSVAVIDDLSWSDSSAMYALFNVSGFASIVAAFWLLWARYKGRQLVRSAELQQARLSLIDSPRTSLAVPPEADVAVDAEAQFEHPPWWRRFGKSE